MLKTKEQRREESRHTGEVQRHEVSSSSCLSLSSVEFLYYRESTAVLSDQICSAIVINNGSSEQYVGLMDGRNKGILANKVYCKHT